MNPQTGAQAVPGLHLASGNCVMTTAPSGRSKGTDILSPGSQGPQAMLHAQLRLYQLPFLEQPGNFMAPCPKTPYDVTSFICTLLHFPSG
jgi:hypothetical protein